MECRGGDVSVGNNDKAGEWSEARILSLITRVREYLSWTNSTYKAILETIMKCD